MLLRSCPGRLRIEAGGKKLAGKRKYCLTFVLNFAIILLLVGV